MSQYFSESATDPRKNSASDVYPIGFLMSVVEGTRSFLLHKQGMGVWVEINPYKIDTNDLIADLQKKADAASIIIFKEETDKKLELIKKLVAGIDATSKLQKEFSDKSLNELSKDVTALKFSVSDLTTKNDKAFITTSIEALKTSLVEEAKKVTTQSAQSLSQSVSVSISKESAHYAEQIAKSLEAKVLEKITSEMGKIEQLAIDKAKETVKAALGSLKL